MVIHNTHVYMYTQIQSFVKLLYCNFLYCNHFRCCCRGPMQCFRTNLPWRLQVSAGLLFQAKNYYPKTHVQKKYGYFGQLTCVKTWGQVGSPLASRLASDRHLSQYLPHRWNGRQTSRRHQKLAESEKNELLICPAHQLLGKVLFMTLLWLRRVR